MPSSVGTSEDEVTQAIYNKLVPSGTIDATLTSLGIVAIYNFRAVPQNEAFDYLTLGDGHELSEDTLDASGFMYFPNLHIWSRQLGTQAGNRMISRLNQLLHRQRLTLATLQPVMCRYIKSRWVDDPDGLTLHGIVTYQIYTTQ